MLKWEPKDRMSASQLLEHYWLKMIPNYNTHMSRDEHLEFKRITTEEVIKEESPESGNVDDLSGSGFSENKQPETAPVKKVKQIVEEGPVKTDDIDTSKEGDDDSD
jgi:hypothetical protein